MDEKEKLIKELEEFAGAKCLDYVDIPEMADFILADRKRIVEPLVKHLKEYGTWKETECCHDAMNETLNLSGLSP